MSAKMKAMVAALVTALVIFYLGTTYFYGPIRESTAGSASAVSPFAALLIVSILMVFFLTWVYDNVGDGAKAGVIIGVSQVLLVDVYYPLQGERSWAAAAASAVLLVAGWWVIGTVYGKLIGGGGDAA